jgi:mismatch-specific thymine-DNA glycosylase
MRTLPDYLRPGLTLVVIGCNPSLRSARVGHYYAGRGNQFWPLLYEGGIVPEPLSYEDDQRVLAFDIGLTDLVKRPTRGVEWIESWEFAEGRVLLAQKLEQLRPRLMAFHGKMVHEKFAGAPARLGLQKGELYGARVFVLPSTSGENTELTRAEKLQHFRELGRVVAKLKKTAADAAKPVRAAGS